MFIYKIWKEDCDECYIGSTVDFAHRKRTHKHSCNNPKSQEYTFKIYSHIRANGGWCSWNMDIIEECETRDREIELIKEMKPSLNTVHYEYDYKEWGKEYRKINADRIKEWHKEHYKKNADRINEYGKEYRKINTDRISERQKEYNKINADKIKERGNQKFNCECGGKYSYKHKQTHSKTKRHQKYLGSS
tara:strand:- start:294 stop:863 length:570 start_codon:yes stop_codon:yes gene_type:complete